MICPKCNRDVDKLTLDHVLPRWFIKRIQNLGKEFPKYKGRLTQRICVDCNCNKGGEFDFTDEDIRTYVKELCGYFNSKVSD